VFADDDVFWPINYLENMVAAFENPKVGASGTCQRTRRTAGSSWYPTNFWNILGISYLERRVFNNLTTNFVDGSISTLSGRSSCWRTEILQCEEFYTYFTTDSWRGKLLNSDDDKCLTRYAYAHGWDIVINTAVCLETTQEESRAYIDQCLRWARARYRGNMTVMGKETYWRSRKYAWGTYVIYVSMLQNPSLLIDLGFAYLLTLIVGPCEPTTRCVCYTLLGLWLLLTKVVRLIPHMLRHPADLVWLPALIAFGYYHGLLNVYAMCTLTQTAWGGKDLTALSKPKTETDETTPLVSHTTTAK
jgi:cellulose synthase/poly-beta-1,6-N-acetylglucosamine synthase-like glycosyltransferase